MNLPQITVRPEKRYDSRGRQLRGARRHDGLMGRTLALFDTLGIRKRAVRTHIALSHEGYVALQKRAADAGVPAAGLAAYIIESCLRERDPGYEEWRDQQYGKEIQP